MGSRVALVVMVEQVVPDELRELFQQVVPPVPAPAAGRRPAPVRGAAIAAGVRPVRADRPPPFHRVDQGTGVAQAAPADPGRAGLARRAGLVAVRDRLGRHAGAQRGDLTGPNPVDRGKNGSKIT